MSKSSDPMSAERAGTPSASYVPRRRYGPARCVTAAVSWLTVFSLFLQSVAAAVKSWTGATDTNWHNEENWDDTTPASTDIAAFLGGPFATYPELPADASVSGLLTDSSNVSITSSGGTLTIGADGIEINAPAGSSPGFDLSGALVKLGADQTWKITCPDTGAVGNYGTLYLPDIDSTGIALNLSIAAKTWGVLSPGGSALNLTVGTVTANNTTKVSWNGSKMTITGDNSATWTGGVLEIGGTVSVSSPNNLGNATVSFLPRGYSVLEYTGSGGTVSNALELEGYDALNGYHADGAATLSAMGAGALICSGTIEMAPHDGNGTYANTLRLKGTSTQNNELQSTVRDGADDGMGSAPALTTLVKQDSGTWVLSGNNTYTGGTTVEGGTLIGKGASSLPGAGTLAVKSGATFSLADGAPRETTTSTLTLSDRAVLAFDWTGAGTGDKLASAAAIKPTANSVIGIAVNRSGIPSGSVTLLEGGAGSTLSSSHFFLANNNDCTATLTTAATTVSIGSYAPATALTTAYWKGGQVKKGATAIHAMNLSSGTTSDWVLDAAGTTPAGGLVPGGARVNAIFGATGATYGSGGGVNVYGNVNLGSITINESSTMLAIRPEPITLYGTAPQPAVTTGAGQAVTPGSAITVTQYAKTDAYGHKMNVILGDNQTWNIATGRKLRAFTIEGNYSLTLGYNSDYAGTVWTWNYNNMGTTDIKYGTLQVADGGMVPGGTVTVHGGATLYDAGEYGGTSILRPVVLTGGTTGAALAGVPETSWGFRTYLGSTLSVSGLNNKIAPRNTAQPAQIGVAGLTTVQSGGSLEIVGGAGTGTATLIAAGGASVNGTLVVNGVLGGGAAVVNSGGTLSGTGTISADATVQPGGALAPGAGAIGQLAITGALTLGGVCEFEIKASDSTKDEVTGVSALTYGGTLKVANLGGTLAVGQSWKLFGFSKRGGTSKFSNDSDFGVPGYSGPNLPTLDSPKQWMFNYDTGELSVAAKLRTPGTVLVVQ